MVCTSAAVAALAALAPPAARADWMVGGFLGNATTLSSTVRFDVPGTETRVDAEGVAYRGRSFEFPLYYGYRVTWLPETRRWLGLELEFIHAKVYAETGRTVRLRGTLRGAPLDTQLPLTAVVSRLEMSHGLNFILANVTVRRGIGPTDASGARRVVAVVRAGAGPTVPHAESAIGSESREQYEGGGPGVLAGGGLEIALWHGVVATGEYKLTWARPTIDIAGGTATIPSRSHHVAVGVGYRF
jgi:opacity protein-like surface antigen